MAETSNLSNAPNPLHFQTRTEFADYYEISVTTFRKRLQKANISLPKGKITPVSAKMIVEQQGEM